MSSFFLPFSLFLPSPSRVSSSYIPLQQWPLSFGHYRHHVSHLSTPFLSFSPASNYSLGLQKSSVGATIPSNEGTVAMASFEDLVEKDWSFLDSVELNTEDHDQKIERIIKAGDVEESSKVLVSVSSEGFVDRLVETSPCQSLLVVHDSLFVLAGIKEKYDKVKCWQGELIYVPEKWAPVDTVFLFFLPALPFKLEEIFDTLAKLCLPGARLVISHPQGREGLKHQREQFPDVVVSDLPEESSLLKVAKNHSFELVEFVDEPRFYLAVLKFSKAKQHVS